MAKNQVKLGFEAVVSGSQCSWHHTSHFRDCAVIYYIPFAKPS